MAMKFEDGGEESIIAEINITPLTDIFLVLLIIFMISSSAMLEGGLNVKLPSAKSTQLSETEGGKPTFVTISAEGEISVNDTRVTDATLDETLKQTLQAAEQKVVIIRGDESIVLGKAVRIMDAARSAGAEKIALATKSPE